MLATWFFFKLCAQLIYMKRSTLFQFKWVFVSHLFILLLFIWIKTEHEVAWNENKLNDWGFSGCLLFRKKRCAIGFNTWTDFFLENQTWSMLHFHEKEFSSKFSSKLCLYTDFLENFIFFGQYTVSICFFSSYRSTLV